MIVDLHAHTRYSNCGQDDPEKLILKMIDCRIDVLGICDHNYGIGNREREYLQEIRYLQKKYVDKIKILCGIEICTRPGLEPAKDKTFSEYDYCLIEDLDNPASVMRGDVINFTKDYDCPVGIAHTDLFNFIKEKGLDCKKYLSDLAKAGIFWELNVNYDSIHGYREHEYVKEFFRNFEQQKAVMASKLYVGIGFDGHRMEDYDVNRVKKANVARRQLGIKNATEIIKQKMI